MAAAEGAPATPPPRGGGSDGSASEPSASTGRRGRGGIAWEEEAEAASGRLLTCQALAELVSSAVAALAAAGSALRRQEAPGTSTLEARLAVEDEPTKAAGRGLAEACRDVGMVLIGLAAALSGEVLAPLQELRRGVEADHAARQEELAQLRQTELLRSNALTECLQKKDRARAGLQGALRERDRAQREERRRGPSWFKRKGDDTAATAEARLQKVAGLQTAAIEELALRTDEAMLARMRVHESTQALSETLGYVDAARKSLLRAAFQKCAAAWDEAAAALHQSAEQFRESVQQLGQGIPACPAGKGALPSWFSSCRPEVAEVAAAPESIPQASHDAQVPRHPSSQDSSSATASVEDHSEHTWRRPINPFEDEDGDEQAVAHVRSRTSTSDGHAWTAEGGGVPARQASPRRRDTAVVTDTCASPSGDVWRPKALTFDLDLSEEEV